MDVYIELAVFYREQLAIAFIVGYKQIYAQYPLGNRAKISSGASTFLFH